MKLITKPIEHKFQQQITYNNLCDNDNHGTEQITCKSTNVE